LNKTIVSLLGFGAGVAATAFYQKQGYFNGRQMKKTAKRLRKTFF
jgi:hypothetical protein